MTLAKKHSHDGHRKRKRKHLLSSVPSDFSDLDILEMLLYYAVPRADTRPTAEALLNEFGSLEKVVYADKSEITKFSGLKDSADVLFTLLRETIARAEAKKEGPSLLEPEQLKKYLIELYKDTSAETVYALYFTVEGNLVGQQLVFRGGISSAKFSLRKITEGAINTGGSSVVLAHNHPSGILTPSTDDVISTKRIAAHLAANDIDLIDHYIVGKDDCVGILSCS